MPRALWWAYEGGVFLCLGLYGGDMGGAFSSRRGTPLGPHVSNKGFSRERGREQDHDLSWSLGKEQDLTSPAIPFEHLRVPGMCEIDYTYLSDTTLLSNGVVVFVVCGEFPSNFFKY